MEHLKTGLTVLAIILFLFSFFRRLRHDYGEDEVVRASIIGLIVGAVFWLFGKKVNILFPLPPVLTLIFVAGLFCRLRSWRFWSTLETVAIPGLISLVLASFDQRQIIVYLLILLSNLYWRNYRRFSWYPSGRAGFLFLINLALVSLANVLLDFGPGRLIELTVWLVLLLTSLIILVLISGRKRELKVEENSNGPKKSQF